MATIYHITLPERWEEAKQRGEYRADSLDTEGFIHCSTAMQVERSLNRFYRGVPRVCLLAIEPERLASRLEYEPAHGEMFPHIYGPLNPDAVVEVKTLTPGEGGEFKILNSEF
jgi:uncharacterized protein (DUF952 family)